MKLKEMPRSLARSIQLRFSNPDALGRHAQPASTEVIISLTSIESRLPTLELTIRSLLDQDVGFQKVVLWLNEMLALSVPKRLRALCSDRFEIRYSKEHGPHRKLIETLRHHEGATVVTCDDDMLYPQDWLARLLATHQQHPGDIIGHECRKVSYKANNALEDYECWPDEANGASSATTLAIGYGGVLYPPKALHPDALNSELYEELAPRADDLWYKAMALRQGTAVRRSENSTPKPTPILFAERVSLKKTNIRQGGNVEQWQRLAERFSLDELLKR